MYMFQADLHCDECGAAMRARLDAEGKAPSDPSDEYTYDSDDYPKGPFPDNYDAQPSGQVCGTCGVEIQEPYDADDLEDAIAAKLEPDEELGDVESFGWYGIYRNVTRQELLDIQCYGTAADLHKEETDAASYIVRIDSQGFKHLESGRWPSDNVEKDWRTLNAEYESFLAEAEPDES